MQLSRTLCNNGDVLYLHCPTGWTLSLHVAMRTLHVASEIEEIFLDFTYFN